MFLQENRRVPFPRRNCVLFWDRRNPIFFLGFANIRESTIIIYLKYSLNEFFRFFHRELVSRELENFSVFWRAEKTIVWFVRLVLFLQPVKGTMLAIFRRSYLDCEIFESCHYRPFDKTPILHRRAWYLHARPRAQACKRELIARWKRQPAVAARNTKGYHCLFEIRLLVEPPFPNRPS